MRTLIDPRNAVFRVTVAAVTGLVATGVAHARGFVFPYLLGWNAGGAALLLLAWLLIATATEETTALRAGKEDPGRTVVYFLVLVASSVSLVSALQFSRRVASMPAADAATAEIFCLITVALAWGLTHTAFTLRYAHLFYRDDGQGVGGVDFPATPTPTYFDFAYFAFTIGMCFQTSDVCISSTQFRRAVLLHAIISFGYNTAIIAFVLNLVFGKVS